MGARLGVSEAGYHAWRKRLPSKKQEADTTLLKRVRTIHASSRETYGAPRVHAELRAELPKVPPAQQVEWQRREKERSTVASALRD